LDNQYLILAFVLTVVGVTGVWLFTGVTPAGGECTCIIPSPENTAMQGTAGILLIFGVMFIPIGILKGGLPGRRAGPPVAETAVSGRTYNPVWMTSGAEFVFGLVLLALGISAIAVAGVVVLDSPAYIVLGVVLAIAGAALSYRGTKIRKQ
jgi:hypothetical protein